MKEYLCTRDTHKAGEFQPIRQYEAVAANCVLFGDRENRQNTGEL